jgi:hypothetical protein
MAEPPFCEDFIQCRGKLGAWELRHKKEGICVREDLSKPMFKFGFFATSHAVCPELFVDIHVEPGSSFEWSRTWSIELY